MNSLMSNQVTAQELLKCRHDKKKKHKEIYDEFLTQVNARIRAANKHGRTFIIFNVPSICFGRPLYNVGNVMKYIITKLTKNGFVVTPMQNTTNLHIDWKDLLSKPKTKPSEPPRKTVRFI
jgi:hypothetical protein